MTKGITVAVFNHNEPGAHNKTNYQAYTRNYNEDWDGCRLFLITETNQGCEAKKVAIQMAIDEDIHNPDAQNYKTAYLKQAARTKQHPHRNLAATMLCARGYTEYLILANELDNLTDSVAQQERSRS